MNPKPETMQTSVSAREAEQDSTEIMQLGHMLARRMGLGDSRSDSVGLAIEGQIGGYAFTGRLLPARRTPSASIEILPATKGGSFAFFKASGLGLVPAALALEASARFRERFSIAEGPSALKVFANALNDSLADFVQGRFLMCTLGSISAAGELSILPAGDPFVFIWRKAAATCMRLKLPSIPAMGMIPSSILEMQTPFKAFKLSLNPGDSAFFLHGEFVDESIAPAITKAFSPAGASRPPAGILETIIASLVEEEVEGEASTWPITPRNDSFVMMLSRRS